MGGTRPIGVAYHQVGQQANEAGGEARRGVGGTQGEKLGKAVLSSKGNSLREGRWEADSFQREG